jgi:hypothetical protein
MFLGSGGQGIGEEAATQRLVSSEGSERRQAGVDESRTEASFGRHLEVM